MGSCRGVDGSIDVFGACIDWFSDKNRREREVSKKRMNSKIFWKILKAKGGKLVISKDILNCV